MLTVMTLAFTVTLNAMPHASGQFTPRILRNFMSDRVNQFVLGYFIGIFYSLLGSLSIRSDEAVQFVPVLTAFAGLIFTLGGVILPLKMNGCRRGKRKKISSGFRFPFFRPATYNMLIRRDLLNLPRTIISS